MSFRRCSIVARTSAKRRSFASVSCAQLQGQRVAELLERAPLLVARLLRLLLQAVTHGVELLREAVDLAALHRRHTAELRGQRLLEVREAAALLGARHARRFGDVVAQLPLEPLISMRLRIRRRIDTLAEYLELLASVRATIAAHQQTPTR